MPQLCGVHRVALAAIEGERRNVDACVQRWITRWVEERVKLNEEGREKERERDAKGSRHETNEYRKG